MASLTKVSWGDQPVSGHMNIMGIVREVSNKSWDIELSMIGTYIYIYTIDIYIYNIYIYTIYIYIYTIYFYIYTIYIYIQYIYIHCIYIYVYIVCVYIVYIVYINSVYI